MVKIQQLRCVRILCVVFACVICLGQLTGCTSLRKKFTREKKKNKEEKFIPVLEPIDYESKQQSAQEQYKLYYGLWVVWMKELTGLIEGEIKYNPVSSKRIESLIYEIKKNLASMKVFLNENKKSALTEAILKFGSIEQMLTQPANRRNNSRIISSLNRFLKEIKNGFSPEVLGDDYTSTF